MDSSDKIQNRSTRDVQKPSPGKKRLRLALGIILIETAITIISLILYPSQIWIFAAFFLAIFLTLIATLQLGTRGEFPSMQEMQLEYGTNVATYTELLKQDMDRSEDLSDQPLNSLSTVDGLTLQAARLTSGYIIQLSSKKPLTVRTVFTGVGRINCVDTGRGGIVPFLDMVEWSESRPSDSGRTPDQQTMNLELPLSFPAEGYFKPDLLHYLVSPAVKLDIPHHGDIGIMVLESTGRRFSVSPAKSDLTCTFGDSKCTVTLSGGEALTGTLDGEGGSLEWANLTLFRLKPTRGRSRWDMQGLVEVIAELKGAGSVQFSWSPSRPSFKSSVFAFKGSSSVSDLATFGK